VIDEDALRASGVGWRAGRHEPRIRVADARPISKFSL
jgi:hypothetical protein